MSTEVIDTGMCPVVTADCIVRSQRVGSLTHFVFAITVPATYGELSLQRDVCIRLVVPNECVERIGKIMLAAGNVQGAICADVNTREALPH